MTHVAIPLARAFSRFSDGVGAFSAVLLILLVANVFHDVVMRYLFNDVSIAMQELEWHLFSMIFLFGVAYTLNVDGHVRVDLVYERLAPRTQALINIVGTVVMLWPFCLLVAIHGWDFAAESYALGEVSGDPGGLAYRWVIKAMIPLSFLCVLVSSLGVVLRALGELSDEDGQRRPGGPAS